MTSSSLLILSLDGRSVVVYWLIPLSIDLENERMDPLIFKKNYIKTTPLNPNRLTLICDLDLLTR